MINVTPYPRRLRHQGVALHGKGFRLTLDDDELQFSRETGGLDDRNL